MAEITTTHCRCDKRRDAMNRGEFQITGSGWIFTNTAEVPPRRTTTKVRWEAPLRSAKWENHHGEPYNFYECVWCGHTLPTLWPQSPTRGTSPQADGGEGPEVL